MLADSSVIRLTKYGEQDPLITLRASVEQFHDDAEEAMVVDLVERVEVRLHELDDSLAY